ncbi:[Fe-Fe] hydrogenase large subunit C-terminal domain-containing protein [Phosphitispora fastidiosa]|uniref:[Fe-Fe] hydrogenase large subunit C-terminal domain-containing protein n=1 Tax=Phosphitispora fastidiosa TaxID=2837202 RepID=UPI001E45FB49|nr:[Fe-Fe] hydrogenase large subunit C-terminal domain-containing protein [Phosphitispora fastidiosa]MBU7007962.1 CheY-specific phosphatase CheX [Phosphitispora fastidiosa]
MGLPEIISLDKDKCQHCLACLLVCPVKLCNVVEPDGISVNPDLCIGCGECIRACREKGHNARSGIDDFPEFLQDSQAGVPLGVLVAPAAAVNYDGLLPRLITSLRELGVKYVFDVSFGAEIAAYQYLKLVKSGTQTPLIAQPCPAVVSCIEIYHTDLIPYLAPTDSPALAAAKWVKSQSMYRNLKLAFLGPCFAKRREVHDPNTRGIVSYNITYQSLDKYFNEQGISLENLEPSGFDSPEAERAVVFSQPGGLTETFRRFGVPFKKADVPRIEGPQEVYLNYLPELENDIRDGRAPLLVDILNCQHGCNIGPAVTHRHTHFQVDRIMDRRREEQIKKHNAADEPNPGLFEEQYKLIDDEKIDFSRAYSDNSSNRYLREPSKEEEELTWERMHKLTEEERSINCASCGYGNCRSMMTAIVNGLNHVESCKYYLFKENEINLNKVEVQAEEIQKSRDEIAAWNEVLERKVAERTVAVRNLLNNAGQGFLTVGPDLCVNHEYSSECRRIFEREIAGIRFAELISPQNEENKEFIESLLIEIFNQESDDMVADLYLPLLPEKIEIGSKHIEAEYKIINDTTAKSKTCMAILTDVTDKRLLENQMENERNTLKMVVKVVVSYNDFIQTVKEYRYFCDTLLHEIINSEKSLEKKIAEIFRYVHTYKGNFSQFYMTGVTELLHDFESNIAAFGKQLVSEMGNDDLNRFVQEFDIKSWLTEDIKRLEDVLGPEFLSSEDMLTISKSKLIELEKKVESILPPTECRILVVELRKLRYRPFDALLESYQDYVIKLAERYQKEIYPVELEAEPVFVDPERYNDFIRSLVHVFRNAVDHGIETMDERIESGKSEYGRIKCHICQRDSKIFLTVADDGRGIDSNKLRSKIVAKGFLGQGEAAGISEAEIVNFIFKDSFSTKDQVTDVSGRGVGLGAVKGELEKLGGSVEVKTCPGQGTEFIFAIPMENEQFWGLAASEIMKPLIETTSNYLRNHVNLEMDATEYFDVSTPERVLLYKFTAYITIKGAIEGLFVISMEEEVLRMVVRKFILEDLNRDEEAEYMEDVLAECTNTILGNSLKSFPGLQEMIVIDTPVSIFSRDALVKYQESMISTCNIETRAGKLCLNIVVPRQPEKHTGN